MKFYNKAGLLAVSILLIMPTQSSGMQAARSISKNKALRKLK